MRSVEEAMGDFHDGDVVRSRSTGAEMVAHYDGDPWSIRHYELVTCPHEAAESGGSGASGVTP